MNKREFIRSLSLGTLGMISGVTLLNSCKSTEGKPITTLWTWISGRHEFSKNWEDKFRELADHGVYGILLLGDYEFVRKVAPMAKDSGLEIHAWIITLNCRNEEVKENHPDWYTISREGKSSLDFPPYISSYNWLCPTKKEVVEYTSARVKKLSEIDTLDGIHLDYIRHCDVILPVGLWSKYDLVQDKEYPEFDFCYCENCRQSFYEKEGIDPMELEDPPSYQSWLQFRYDSVTNLVNQLSVITKERGKKLTAAVFPSPSIAKKLVRQEWTKWNLDAVFPMMYHNYYEEDVKWIEKVTREGVDGIKGDFPIFSGLFIPALSPGELPEAVDYALRGGADGVTLFNEGRMKRKHWKRIT